MNFYRARTACDVRPSRPLHRHRLEAIRLDLLSRGPRSGMAPRRTLNTIFFVHLVFLLIWLRFETKSMAVTPR
jgi:hypothetical protein